MKNYTNKTLVYNKQAPQVIDECIFILYKNDYLGLLTDQPQNKICPSKKKKQEDLSQLQDLLLDGESQQQSDDIIIDSIAHLMRTQTLFLTPDITPLQYLLRKTVSYIDFDEFLADLIFVVKEAASEANIHYLAPLLYHTFKLIQKKFRTKFIDLVKKDIQCLFQCCGFYLYYAVHQEEAIKSWHIPTSEMEFRCYTKIKVYVGAVEIMVSKHVPVVCPLECDCQSKTDYNCEYECENIQNRILCRSQCGCQNYFDPTVDREEEVKEIIAWGMDFYTKKNIFYLLVGEEVQFNIQSFDQQDDTQKFQFIESSLQRALNQQGMMGYLLQNSLEYIQDQAEFSNYDKMQAQQLLKALKFDKNQTAFRIHSKGKGVICIKQDGFTKGQYITTYLGEVYTAARWCDKQDLIKKMINGRVPEFFNIVLSRREDDQQIVVQSIYEYQIIDPTNKGNFASRFSHSCRPNCYTTVLIKDNNYFIGMFALLDIQSGEEMTFDYFSGTTSLEEYSDSQCLCGTINQSHNYLKYYNWRQYIQDWEMINLRMLMASIDSELHWFEGWMTKSRSIINSLSDKDIKEILTQSLKMTVARIEHYFKLLSKQDVNHTLHQQSPITLLTQKEVCLLFLGQDSIDSGEIFFIRQHITDQHLLGKLNQYLQIINLSFRKGEYEVTLKEIQILLKYLSIKVEPYDLHLSQLLNQRSLIRKVVRENQFPRLIGKPFTKKDFNNCRNLMNYEALEPTIPMEYSSEFLWRVTNDLTQDSKLQFRGLLIRQYGVFVNSERFKEHQQFLERENYFYSVSLEDNQQQYLSIDFIHDHIDHQINREAHNDLVIQKKSLPQINQIDPSFRDLPEIKSSITTRLIESFWEPSKVISEKDIINVGQINSEAKLNSNIQVSEQEPVDNNHQLSTIQKQYDLYSWIKRIDCRWKVNRQDEKIWCKRPYIQDGYLIGLNLQINQYLFDGATNYYKR